MVRTDKIYGVHNGLAKLISRVRAHKYLCIQIQPAKEQTSRGMYFCSLERVLVDRI